MSAWSSPSGTLRRPSTGCGEAPPRASEGCTDYLDEEASRPRPGRGRSTGGSPDKRREGGFSEGRESA
jgi:hypothetical protein